MADESVPIRVGDIEERELGESIAALREMCPDFKLEEHEFDHGLYLVAVASRHGKIVRSMQRMTTGDARAVQLDVVRGCLAAVREVGA